LLECAGPAYADRNLRELASINRWFGGHRALLRVTRVFVHPNEHFSVLDVGAGSGDMAGSLTCHFRNVKVVALDHRASRLRNAPSPRLVAYALRLPFAKHAFHFVLCSSVQHHFPDREVIDMISTLRQFARRALLLQEPPILLSLPRPSRIPLREPSFTTPNNSGTADAVALRSNVQILVGGSLTGSARGLTPVVFWPGTAQCRRARWIPRFGSGGGHDGIVCQCGDKQPADRD
jgi:SAM-dependent methyltransferase